ncbi:hypothetical protein [Coralloluteibacterium stylophorae]|uniref:Uncharacterized protein n=1 Tax=Coralloluteibacterium stylophorae TaxID=1776034 RepID=A0A8J8AX54_9GAMM|nr:hypothetical protein [Coralloluteibacterium stylophorae]MBS7457865.1 hypothetical protein [Coralloluteibacterium stylophorae]
MSLLIEDRDALELMPPLHAGEPPRCAERALRTMDFPAGLATPERVPPASLGVGAGRARPGPIPPRATPPAPEAAPTRVRPPQPASVTTARLPRWPARRPFGRVLGGGGGR